ncbi:hypothetical protein [Streptomyces sp. NBC_01615]|uniref:hypothetical protein n=1 Tax=Streptomyces sp. NBC_01615 TaxID=2975898 RepID=UPI00386B5E7F
MTTAQATTAGASPDDVARLHQAQIVEPVAEGVFRIRAGGRHPFPRLLAQWLLLDPERGGWERQIPQSGVVSHRSALRMHGLGDWPGSTTEFTLPSSSSLRSTADIVVHTRELSADEWQVIAGLPVTSPGCTLADLALDTYADVDALGRVATAILRRGLADRDALARSLNRCDPPAGGAKRLEELLATQDEAV